MYFLRRKAFTAFALLMLLSLGVIASAEAEAQESTPVLEGDPQEEAVVYTTLDGRPALLRCASTPNVLRAAILDEDGTFEFQDVQNPEICSGYMGPENIIAFEDDPLDARMHPVYVVIEGVVAITWCTNDMHLIVISSESESSVIEWEETSSMTCYT